MRSRILRDLVDARAAIAFLAFLTLSFTGCGADESSPASCPGDCMMAPAPRCEGGRRVTFQAFGECVAGICEHARLATTDCENGCADGACIERPDPCDGVVCDDAPAAACDGQVAVRPDEAPGTCADGTCTYGERRTDCALRGEVCVDGSCRPPGPCEALACDTPPDATCDGSVALRAVGDGTCDPETVTCTWEIERIDCAATEQLCAQGRCLDAPPCEGRTCVDLPGPRCEGPVAVAAANGRCDLDDDTCVFDEVRTDCRDEGLTCSDGLCAADPSCAGIVCTTPPANRCEQGRAVRVEGPGYCADAECIWERVVDDCVAQGLACQTGRCVDAACASVTCTSPPAPACDGTNALRWMSPGTCDAGACTYDVESTDCAEEGLVCEEGACVAPPLCDTASCTVLPAPRCVGDRLVSAFGAGVCEPTGCRWAESEIDCAARGEACRDGACRGPCDGVTCDAPPAPTCEGNQALGWVTPGTCTGGACQFVPQVTNCRLTGEVCVDGACVPDPCDTLACDTPPAPSCDDDVAVAPFGAGQCIDGACRFLEVRTDCAADGLRCVGGACRDACFGIDCVTPPDPTCDGDDLMVAVGTGVCTLPSGGCAWSLAGTDCTASGQICLGGACVDDPCGVLSCDAPPAPTCDGDVEIVPFGEGACSRGVCSWAERRRDCAADGERCIDGACRDACFGVTCDDPPAARCDGDVLRAPAPVGICTLPAGECTWADVATNCALTGEICLDGACVPDPCLVTSCDVLPEPVCDGEVLVTVTGAGVCDRGTCNWPEQRRDCAADGLACRDGGCRDACFGVICDAPPADTCDGDTLLVRTPAGTCSPVDGNCSYGVTPVDCLAEGQICVDGRCVADPCAALSCDVAPASFCIGDTEVEPFGVGVCERGVCSFAERQRDCAAEGLTCQDGACRDACFGVTCTTPPADFCSDVVAFQYGATGVCDALTGACTYPVETDNCGIGDRRCVDGRCEADPCASVVCEDPAPDCVGDVARVRAAGLCSPLDGSCVFAESLTDCAASGLTCLGGACVDACFGVDCGDAPDPVCIGSSVYLYLPGGTCDTFTGACSWDADITDCAATGERCVDAVCVPDPCAGVLCEPPVPFCDGDTAVRPYGGTCNESGSCDFIEQRTACGTFGFACEDGACVSPCEGTSCTETPPPFCIDVVTLAVPTPPGTCDDEAFLCIWDEELVNCSLDGRICLDGACVVPDLCAGIVCDDEEPRAACAGRVVFLAVPTGTCRNGFCEFENLTIDCEETGEFCFAGACQATDPCEGVTCTSPPPSECVGNVALSYSGGSCGDGNCVYGRVLTDCADAGGTCVDGACTTPPGCDGVVCESPPPGTCIDATRLRGFLPRGTCTAGGTCVYREALTDCGAFGSVCVAGACQ